MGYGIFWVWQIWDRQFCFELRQLLFLVGQSFWASLGLNDICPKSSNTNIWATWAILNFEQV